MSVTSGRTFECRTGISVQNLAEGGARFRSQLRIELEARLEIQFFLNEKKKKSLGFSLAFETTLPNCRSGFNTAEKPGRFASNKNFLLNDASRLYGSNSDAFGSRRSKHLKFASFLPRHQ
jgi:hypothetical protein